MTEPTPEKQSSPAAPDENTSQPKERDGFFRRVQRVLKPVPPPVHPPVHPSEAQEIVVDMTPIPIKRTEHEEA
jgi:hypothetical protein